MLAALAAGGSSKGMAYRYDVFISYKRSPFRDEWVIRHFLPRFEDELREQVFANCKRHLLGLFFDQTEVAADVRVLDGYGGIEPGQIWREALIGALKSSRCMISLLSPTYFGSAWCQSEWLSFLQRENGGQVLLFPVSVFNSSQLPAEARRQELVQMEDYVFDGEGFIHTREYVDFQKRVKQLAKYVGRAVCTAPDFQDFPIVVPPDDTPAPRPVGLARF
jgi:hypothetical protein